MALAQVGWVILAATRPPFPIAIGAVAALFVLEISGPMIAEVKLGGTPWNAHHIEERYGLLAIIAFGEVLLGTVTSVSALVTAEGWSTDAILVVVAGVALTFGLWWAYFTLPSGEVLARHRRRAGPWSYAHLVLYASIAATGAGLQVAASVVRGEAAIGIVGAALSVSLPVLLFTIALLSAYTYLVRDFDPFHVGLLVLAAAGLAGAVLTAATGAPIGISLLLVTLAPIVIVIGYEVVGHRHDAEVLERNLSPE